VLLDYPVSRIFYGGFAEHFTVVIYDKPGCGLSDRAPADLTLDAQVRTLATVVDQLALARFALFAFSMAGPAAIAYTAQHPDRVAQLILLSTRAWTPPPDDPAQAAAVWAATTALMRAEWGLGSLVLAQMPGTDALTREWMARLMRESTDAEIAIALTEEFQRFDVRELLPAVAVPTLVQQRRHDAVNPFPRGQELAMGIPHARFLLLEGGQHAVHHDGDHDVLRATLAYLDEPTIAARFIEEREPVLPDGLSEREVQVLRLLASGKSNREIADWLVLSPHTVARHVSNILDKAGVQNRTEAATYAARLGLLE
jgi:pimeloyl-ACP methyl ester carboxylesterase/DNA-binding CsgD family transcriptional regulator